MMILLSFAAIIALLSNVAVAVPYGQVCDNDAACTEANNKCVKDSDCSKGWCLCASGFGFFNYSCVTEKLIGDSCTTYCTAGTCNSGKCECGAGLVASPDRTYCTGKALGETCTSNCAGSDVICNGTCKCAPGYKELASKSCSYYNDGDTCTLGTTVCSPGASCSNATNTNSTKCACDTSYVWWSDARICVHTSAVKNVGYGETCKPNDYSSTGRFCAAGLVCKYCPTNTTSSVEWKCFNGVGQTTPSSGQTTPSSGQTTPSSGQTTPSSLAIVTVLLIGIKIFTA